jgi:hypothetical protein
MSGPNAADHPGPAEAKQRHQANGQCLAAGRPSTGENQDGHVFLDHSRFPRLPNSSSRFGDRSLDQPPHPHVDHLRRRRGLPPPSNPGMLPQASSCRGRSPRAPPRTDGRRGDAAAQIEYLATGNRRHHRRAVTSVEEGLGRRRPAQQEEDPLPPLRPAAGGSCVQI